MGCKGQYVRCQHSQPRNVCVPFKRELALINCFGPTFVVIHDGVSVEANTSIFPIEWVDVILVKGYNIAKSMGIRYESDIGMNNNMAAPNSNNKSHTESPLYPWVAEKMGIRFASWSPPPMTVHPYQMMDDATKEYPLYPWVAETMNLIRTEGQISHAVVRDERSISLVSVGRQEYGHSIRK
jgi:hypothetical protein